MKRTLITGASTGLGKELAKLYGGFPEMIKFDHYQFLSYILPRACMYDVLEIWNFKYYSRDIDVPEKM